MTVAERSAHWQGIIDKQAASGRSAAAYCREEHIHAGRFYCNRLKDLSWRLFQN